jgi:hypothetical protein
MELDLQLEKNEIFEGILLDQVSIRIDPTGRGPCPLWIGVYRAGKATPFEVLQQASIQSAFDLCAGDGLAETQHLLLSDQTTQRTSQYIYMFLWDLFEKEGLLTAMGTFTEKVGSLHPSSIGIYMHPEIYGETEAMQLTSQIVKTLVEEGTCSQIYLLQGAFDYNRLLNLSLQLKLNIDTSKRLVHVYH